MKYLFSLGSNLPDRLTNLSNAIKKLNFLDDIKVSSIYESKALILNEALPEWDKDFLNLCISGASDIAPLQMLKQIKCIEQEAGRDLNSPKWSPRIIDIDIILAGNHIINDNKITIPHREALKRDFVLIPACEIEPDIIHPIINKPLHKVLKELNLNHHSKVIKTKLELLQWLS